VKWCLVPHCTLGILAAEGNAGYPMFWLSDTLLDMKVLLGVDGSSNSLATVSFVGRLLSAERDQLILAHVSPPLPYLLDDQLDPGVADRAQGALSAAVFDEAMLRLPEAWQEQTERMEITGSPGDRLLTIANERSVELIAVGFRGTGMFERFLLGSVSRAVVHSALVPVLVVKTAGEPASEKTAGVADGSFQVLAAYDGSEFGERIALVIGKLTWAADARGWVISVVPPMSMHQLPDWLPPIQRDPDVQAMAEAWQKEHEQQLVHAKVGLQEYQGKLPAMFRSTEPVVAEGNASEQILAAIFQKKIDLVVVGSRGSSTVQRLLVGSTSARVINEAPCSVLVAR